jgi:hypothetical protein
MTTSEQIRALAGQGLSTTEIARRLGIRYQQAYRVLRRAGSVPIQRPKRSRARAAPGSSQTKPPLTVEILTGGGFTHAGRWVLTDAGEIALERPITTAHGVYAFAIDETVRYVGVATRGLARRMRAYAKPGPRQLTSHRLNGLIKAEIVAGRCLDIYVATPGDLAWNGLPVHGSAGLELGLIKAYALPWNKRGTR